MTVTFCSDTEYTCTTAVKGSNYVILYNGSDVVASFFGVTDFTKFAISGGSWTTGLLDDASPVLKVFDVTLSTTWNGSEAPYTQTFNVNGVTASSEIHVLPALSCTVAQVEQFDALNIKDGGQETGKITLRAYGDLNTSAIPIRFTVRG